MRNPGFGQVETSAARGRVWDAPVRVFHWLFAACFGIAWLTREMPDLDLHATAGYAMFVLVIFRCVWGFVGSPPARFSNFAYSPRAGFDYMRRAITGNPGPEYLGHNPAGSWAIYLFLATGLAATASGMLLLAAEHGFGPLAGMVSAAPAQAIQQLHETIAWAMVLLFVWHMAGVTYGSWSHRQNLVAAIISGNKQHLPPDFPAVPRHAGAAVALAAGVLAGCYAYLHATGWTESYATLREQAKSSSASSAASAWTQECSECHLAYPAQLLPARSWQRMLAEQQEHFGDDLGLPAAKLAALGDLAVRGAAAPGWVGRMVQASVAAKDSPQRITETEFWRQRHRRIAKERFKSDQVAGKHDCGACHADALSGIFSPRLIQIPQGRPKS
ncbi:MAG: hypothetical protein D4S02_15075 [Rhodocyclaceae bacterium]|nr:MAG: hypothetical protein D4S02_15075 [Rhodocyclaceae bacterium]